MTTAQQILESARPRLRELSRRGFLTRTATTGLAAGGLGGLLTACDVKDVKGGLTRQPLPPSPHHPVLLPVRADNQPIASGRRRESGATLRICGWPGRVSRRCANGFARAHGCHVEVSTFASMSDAIAAMASGHARFDVLAGVTIDLLGGLVQNNLIQPLNHSYIPNISQAWDEFVSPFYDLQWQYTVPYMIYTTGIGWRKDLIGADPFAMANGWSALWQRKFAGKAAILSDYRQVIGLGLLKNGVTDLNTPDPRLVDAAGRALSDLATLAHPQMTADVSIRLGKGRIAIAQVLSGQVTAAARYLPPRTRAGVLGYWFPPDAAGPVANDTMAIPRDARHPVLAHLFLNYMLNRPNALISTAQTGFMQPLTWMTPERLIRMGIIPAALISTTVLENYFYRGLKEFQLQAGAQALWEQVWHSVARQLTP